MSKTLEIMFDDLNSEAQQEVLRFYDCKTPEDGNFDIAPLFVLELEESEE